MRTLGRKHITLIIAVAMVLFVSVSATLAYFSDYDTAQGEKTLVLSGQTTIEETPKDDSKDIKITNVSKDDVDMVVRVRVIGPVKIDFNPGTGWVQKQQDDEWWYYNKVLAKGESTSNLFAGWKIPENSDLENFDVVVVHESAIATYDGNKVAKPAGWDYIPVIEAK